MSEPKLLTAEQLQILQHALGLDEYGLAHYYRDGVRHYGFMPTRNHFCAGGADENRCRELVALGYMKQHHTTEVFPYFNCSVTDAGKEAVRRESPAPPKLTRSQKRYRDFLDADTGYSFREWLGNAKGGQMLTAEERAAIRKRCDAGNLHEGSGSAPPKTPRSHG